ncbi:MAG: HDOD domain-containing protein [Alteromonadaceae bacterium]|nr:HDOD domain-containing protein [Alteromonadaceae bacterium]
MIRAIEYASFASEVFVLPAAVTKIQVMLNDERATMDDFANVVKIDPTLASQLLKIVNSPIYNFRDPVDSVMRAVRILGTKAIYDLAISYGVACAFNDYNKNTIDLERFWEYSVRTALFSQYWAQRLALHEPERFFTAGLIHNIGELVVVRRHPKTAVQCTRFMINEQPWEKQQSVMGYTYKDITIKLLQVWGLPSSIIDLIKPMHESPHHIGSIDSKVVQLAYHQSLLESYPSLINDICELPEHYAISLGLNQSSLDKSVDNIRHRLLTVVSLFTTYGYGIN